MKEEELRPFRYCPTCGHPMKFQIPIHPARERWRCDHCDEFWAYVPAKKPNKKRKSA